MKKRKIIYALLFSTTLMFSQSAGRNNAAITAVTGESWLHHLHRSFDETSMGKTWLLGPATEESASGLIRSAALLSESSASPVGMETLHGSDLYRLNCQSCHGEFGLGAPPEIGSLIDPVRATSTVLVEQRMKKVGMEFSRSQTAELVNQSQTALLKRLHDGGKDMPSFHHLSPAEIGSLLAYLKQLAGVPGAEKEQIAVVESDARVGELIVKSTCHICHGATGTNPTPAELSDGTIPPLSALPVRVNEAQLVRKVTRGAPVIMGAAPAVYRGRMPVFSYLKENEAADVYEYLTHFPPSEAARSSQVYQSSPSSGGSAPDEPIRGSSVAPQARSFEAPVSKEQSEPVALPISVGLLVAVLLALGCYITLREFRSLSDKSRTRTPSRRRERVREPQAKFQPNCQPNVEVSIDSARRRAESVQRKPSNLVNERKIS